MGLPAGPPLRLVEPVEPSRAGTLELPPLVEMEQQAMRQRPEVVADEAALRIQNLGVSLERLRRQVLPTLSLTADVTPRSTSGKASSTVLASATVPLWDAGVSFANEQIARSSARSAAAVLEQTKKDVASQVDQAYYNYVSALQRVTASQAAVDAAAANLEATNARFRLGAAGVSVVDLVTAQAQYAQAAENLVSARYDVIQDLAQLNRAVGR
jgi:outer membrane protein TolC